MNYELRTVNFMQCALHHRAQDLLEELHVLIAPLVDGALQGSKVCLLGSDDAAIVQDQKEFVVVIVISFLEPMVSQLRLTLHGRDNGIEGHDGLLKAKVFVHIVLCFLILRKDTKKRRFMAIIR